MNKTTRTLLIGGLIAALGGCATVTITPNGGPKLKSQPTYEAKQTFFLGGLIGERHVDVQAICQHQPVRQMQTVDTFSDGLLRGLTLGIYAPRTARVWCEQGDSI
jgi:hypothetical protein